MNSREENKTEEIEDIFLVNYKKELDIAKGLLEENEILKKKLDQ